MKKKLKQDSSWIRDVMDSENMGEHTVGAMRKIKLANIINYTGIFFLLALGMVALVQGDIQLGFVDHFVALLLLLNVLYLIRSKKFQSACFFGIIIIGVHYCYLLFNGGGNDAAYLWYFTFPLFASFILGSNRGAVATSMMFILAILFFTVESDLPYTVNYSKDFKIQFIPVFVVIFIFSYTFEYFREKAEKKLISKNLELNRTITELKEADTMLRKAREELEKRVQERTRELLQANSDLKYEIKERGRTEHERRILESKLLRSQKMEALGVLAGGVAHDLNNVLSAAVSYPDLLLMDLPENSPLREPILTIQESGERAAAIVQDLLTLARRGVVLTEVTNLNQVIQNFFKAPEFKELQRLYPKVAIKSNFETALMNIMGSPVHLLKIVMNLLENAAEAIADGGDIIISTHNRYIDKPIKGYDYINGGDYVVLSVLDTGSGISSGDLERIFEPFFTKKIMGRSGTGLGMAVVWGTVQDHNGYIDVTSTKDKGTEFTLYFPATRDETPQNKRQVTIEKYMAKGESILVVDDIKEQRIIASKMLTKLGYSVESVSSGEKAIEYLRENTVDLIVLDMIMDPGIDGLTTYKQILELHPNQKAIIASGFSETDRVKEVRKIGAGAYIKKPYTLEKIGMVVKAEFEKNKV